MKGYVKAFAFAVLMMVLMILPNKAVSAYSLPCMPPEGFDQGGKYPAGTVRDVYYYSNNTHSERKLVVYTPPGYTTSKKYPVIYGVHGINNWPGSLFADWCVPSHILADNLIGEGKIEPVIIVAFDNNNVNSHNELFNAVIPYVESHYSVQADADHRGIYGYSMGGGVAFAEGIGNLDTFHHVCPTSALPANHPSDEQMFPNGGAVAKQKLKTLLLSCGTIDWCGFYPSNLATHEYCVRNNIPHGWLSVEGGNHDGGVWSPAMWNFLQMAFPADGVTPEIKPNPPVQEQPKVPGDTVTIKDGWYYIKSVMANKYLQVKDANPSSSANVEISTKTGIDAQKWYIKNVGNGYITIKSALGDFMLDINGASDKDDANVQIYQSHGGNAQQFMVKSTYENNVYVIATKASNLTKAIDVANGRTEDGTNVVQFSYNGNSNQQWCFESAEELKPEPSEEVVPGETNVIKDGWYLIKSASADKFLTVKDGSATAGANVELGEKVASTAQKWYVKNLTNGYVTIKSALGEFMIDIAGGSSDNNANVQIYHGYSGDAQQFIINKTSANGVFEIATKASNGEKVLDVANGRTDAGANVIQYARNGNQNQQWYFIATNR